MAALILDMIKVIYEDDHIVVVIKPKGMLSQADQMMSENLYDLMCQQLSVKSLGMVQRLDRPVGGLMVFGKSQEANKTLMDQMQNRAIKKVYLALVEGEPKNQASLSNYIQKVRGNRAIVSNKKTPASKEAKLTYTVSDDLLKPAKGTLLEVQLETGRFHQIRAQLAHHKLPIVGDTKYNPTYQVLEGWHDLGLYAYKLEFKHPISGKKLSFESLPKESPFVE